MEFNLALLQFQIDPNFQKNENKIVSEIKKVARKGADVVLLPELHCYPYFCQTKDKTKYELAENIPGTTTDLFCELAKQLNIIIITSIYEKADNNKLYNTAVVIEKNGKISGKYRKNHIPDCPEYNETFYFEHGDTGFNTIQTSIGNLGILVCYDQWFPEGARKLALKGADIILIPTAIGYTPTDTKQKKDQQLNAWLTIQRAHAIANGIPLASCNRVGFENNPDDPNTGIDFWGNSFICGPFGEILHQSQQQECHIIGKIDLRENNKIKKTWPFLKERKAHYDL